MRAHAAAADPAGSTGWFGDRPFSFVSSFRIRVSAETTASNQKRVALAPGDPSNASRRLAAAYAGARPGDTVAFAVPLRHSQLVVGFPKAFQVRPSGDLAARGVVPDRAIVTPIVEASDDPVLQQALEIAAQRW